MARDGGRRATHASAVLALFVLAGCASTAVPQAVGTPTDQGSIAVSEVLTAPATDPEGLAFSVALRNDGDTPVRVTEVSAVADEGLEVEVLGASTCRAGCPGAMKWQDAEPMIASAIEYPGAFSVPPSTEVLDGRTAAVKVVLRVRAADAAARSHLEKGCLFVRQLLVRVDDAQPVPARNDHAEFVVALDRPDAGLGGVRPGCAETESS
jgi:hypothetical protein